MKNKSFIHRFNRLTSFQKLLIGWLITGISFLLFSPIRMEPITRTMICWDVFGSVYIIMSLITFFSMHSKEIRLLVSIQDSSRLVVFLTVLVSTLSSLLGILILLLNKGSWILNKYVETFIYILGVSCSWMLLHIIFTFRYAHMYYRSDPSRECTISGGLEIPNEKYPDYIDFAYFSFVIGMTFQVSDISISSRSLRRLVLLHGMLAFLFNTVIVALSINVILDLKG